MYIGVKKIYEVQLSFCTFKPDFMRFCLKNEYFFKECTEGPRITWILGLEKKIMLREYCVRGTVIKTQITQESPTCPYLSQNQVKWGLRY